MSDVPPDAADRTSVPSTTYARGHLLISGDAGITQTVRRLRTVARELGWDVELRNLDGSGTETATALDRARRGRDRFDLPTVYRVQVLSAPASGSGARTSARVDARRLLERVRAHGTDGLSPLSLDHILSIDPMAARDAAGRSDGRQVAHWSGPTPVRTAAVEPGGRRPVVAVLDTGCGTHPWLGDDVVTRAPVIDGTVVGLTDPATDPEAVGDVTGALDGEIDPVSGHGTFIAGIVRQVCPDADIVSARVTDSEGTVLEGTFFYAVRSLVKGMLLPPEEGGRRIDVLNLSLSYYDESPKDLLDRALVELLDRVRQCGCAVVCSAGNEGSDRPTFPAALWEWDAEPAGGRVGFAAARTDGAAPHVAVGATDPDGTIAPFSNVGPWVHVYVPGASVLSAFPPLNGGGQARVRTHAAGRRRETVDVDDFRGGFALWSGTSFAAPFVAAALAQALVEPLTSATVNAPDERAALLADAAEALVARYARAVG